MKSIHLNFALAAALAALSFARPAAAVPIVTVAPANSIVAVGDTFVLDINVSTPDVDDAVFAFQFDLLFDPALLQAVGATEGSFLNGGGATFFVEGVADNTAGQFLNTANTLLTAINGVAGDGTLASVTFHATGAGVSAITIANLILLDSTLLSMGPRATGGSVTIVSAAPVPEPASAALMGIGLIALIGLWRIRGVGVSG